MTNVVTSGSGLQPAKLREMPSWLITQTATVTHRMVGVALARVDATRYQYAILTTVEEFGPISQAELSRRCHIDRSDIVATLNDLAVPGHIDRTRNPRDKRQNLVTLTQTGRRRLNEIAQALSAVQSSLIGDLSPAHRSALVTALQQILDTHTSSSE